MANPYPAVFRDDNSDTRLAGAIDFTDSGNQPGFSPVACYITAGIADVKTPGSYPALWTALADNPWDGNPLAAIPSGLGLTFVFDGTSATLTTTMAGTWAFTLVGIVVVDAGNTWTGSLRDSMATSATYPPSWGTGTEQTVTGVYTLPAAAQLAPEIVAHAAGNGVPALSASVALTVVRLG